MEENLDILRKIVNELISRLPDDCKEIAMSHSQRLFNDIKDKGLKGALKSWYYIEDEEEILALD
ncbi:hypothetical protein GWK48_01525 [Metallosphaera tengchongensis]|uniref:Uncharacterized protein n=1 Tax=Metallosphaera tengchongensis TaxID=1532350 RepID=A0A6N0NVS1_9CREN|nr:hypothetical protein [Metallosphaera tengchongensis]QKQ99249.1 hypothetical protein GWK48_01525 [Metallosphaera tengchongensis]